METNYDLVNIYLNIFLEDEKRFLSISDSPSWNITLKHEGKTKY